MKTLKKILPLTALTAVGTVPVIATSCSNVYVDLYTKLYQPKFDPAEAKELTSPQVIDLYKQRFVNKTTDAIDDFYWGSSIYCREVLGKDKKQQDKVEVLAYLNHIYDVKIELPEGKTRPVISYKLKAQVQLKYTSTSKSYSVRTYDLYWEINNLEFWAFHYDTITVDDKKHQMWSLCPFKFDNERGTWWQELKGNEQVKFDFKTVIKGYGEDGGQNYAWEGAEAAIIDEEHKYAPELNEVYTSVMLFDSYYLNQISPKLDIEKTWLRAPAKGGTITNNLTFIFGDKTKTEGGTVKLTKYGDPVIYHTDESTLEVGNFSINDITPNNPNATVTISYSGTPKTGDIVYYTIKADHEKTTGDIDWTDYFFISSVVDNN